MEAAAGRGVAVETVYIAGGSCFVFELTLFVVSMGLYSYIGR